MNETIKVIDEELKNRCSSGEFLAIREAMNILFENKLVALRRNKGEVERNQGYLSALEELDLILSKR